MIKNKKVENIDGILSYHDICIPDYQRAYSWTKDSVIQLLEDILEDIKENKKNEISEYRLGTIILHNDKDNKNNIVDGQQRLITLSILLFLLSEEKELKYLNESKFSKESEKNIIRNKKDIESWISISINNDNNNIDRNEYAKYIKENCFVVVIVLDDLNEAFQLFDSQNSRGKSLEPYDLLKAYHLRELARIRM